MTITVIGASGFIGQNYIRHLLMTTDFQVRAYCRSAEKLDFGRVGQARVELLAGDIFDEPSLTGALDGADAAVFLVHLMQENQDYAAAEGRAAAVFVAAARAAHLPRVVFLGGLGQESEQLSAHLRSRHRTGEILREGLPRVIELRAGLIIGEGSVGFDVIRTLADTLPAMAIPSWAVTEVQPIGIEDVVRYLTQALTVSIATSEIVEIGGPTQLTYPMVLARYAKFRGRLGYAVSVPFVPRRLARWWLARYMKPKDAIIGGAMVDSLHNSMIVRSDRAAELFPEIRPSRFENSFK